MVERLTNDEKLAALKPLKGWKATESRDAISRSFEFKNFNAAFAFMTQCALRAEKQGHHPEWFNVFNHLDVTLTTHEAKGITPRDIDMATFMNEKFKQFQ